MSTPLLVLYGITQALYLGALLVVLWFYTRPTNLVDRNPDAYDVVPVRPDPDEILMLYPVLHELESTMRTTMLGFERASFPGGRIRVIAIPNEDDEDTIASLRNIQKECPFLEIMPVPKTDDPSWEVVWGAWQSNPKAYWWHQGKRRHERALPPKKTRQLIYAFYTLASRRPLPIEIKLGLGEDALLSYIDADSVVPEDYFRTAIVGMRSYDVVQNTNVAGNLLASWAASMFAKDHMSWDGSLYPHMTADGKQPFWVLGKGLFFRVSDLVEVGGFNPWLTIEDPEVGMRLWTNGRRLGVVRSPLVEEVPDTFGKGVTQRKRWVAGFFQSLGKPLTLMGMTLGQRIRARLNFVPCLSLLINPVGLGIGIWALVATLTSSHRVIDVPLEVLSLITLALAVFVIGFGQLGALRQSRLVVRSRRERAKYLFRVNPVFLFLYWIWWSVPMAVGFWMYLGDRGQRWERTAKVDANHDLVREAEPEVQPAIVG